MLKHILYVMAKCYMDIYGLLEFWKCLEGGIFFKDRHYIYFKQTDRGSVLYGRSNFTEELGKAGWTELYFIIPTNIHTTGVRKPLVVKAGLPHSQTLVFLKTSICIT